MHDNISITVHHTIHLTPNFIYTSQHVTCSEPRGSLHCYWVCNMSWNTETESVSSDVISNENTLKVTSLDCTVVTTGVASTPMPPFCSVSRRYRFNLNVIPLTQTLTALSLLSGFSGSISCHHSALLDKKSRKQTNYYIVHASRITLVSPLNYIL